VLTVLTTLIATQAVPDPPQFVGRDLEVTPQGVLVLAQAPKPEEEKNLSDDMDKAHQRIHGDKTKVQATEDNSTEEPTRRRSRNQVVPKPMVDGHGRGYYIAWGSVDWGLASGFWTAALAFLVDSAVFNACASDTGTCNSRYNSTMTSGDYRNGARVLGVLTGVSGLVGGYFAWRGAHNIGIYHDMAHMPANP
jgi:hypothetical protein